MTNICTLTDVPSWFSCLQNNGVPFTEFMSVAIFAVFFIAFKAYGTREALQGALFITSVVSFLFLGLGLINPALPVAYIIILAGSAVFLNSQNNP